MVVYEVNLKVDSNRAEEFRLWLTEHVQAMLALPGFVDAQIFSEEASDAAWRNWTVHYRLENRDALENYFVEFASAMRGDGLERFGDSFSASRRILLLSRGGSRCDNSNTLPNPNSDITD